MDDGGYDPLAGDLYQNEERMMISVTENQLADLPDYRAALAAMMDADQSPADPAVAQQALDTLLANYTARDTSFHLPSQDVNWPVATEDTIREIEADLPPLAYRPTVADLERTLADRQASGLPADVQDLITFTVAQCAAEDEQDPSEGTRVTP